MTSDPHGFTAEEAKVLEMHDGGMTAAAMRAMWPSLASDTPAMQATIDRLLERRAARARGASITRGE